MDRGWLNSAGGDGVRSGRVDAASSSAKNSLIGVETSPAVALRLG